jgi:hypothetical protein
MSLTLVTIRFPEIRLQTRDAHKLRGYFGNLFQEHSPLLHNHYETGELRYKYPLVQYKVLDEIPTLVALDEGAKLLTSLFMKIRELNIDGQKYEIFSKNIESRQVETGFADELHEYRFKTLWMALNQENFKRFLKESEAGKQKMLDRTLIGNILSFFKGIDLRLENEQRLMAKVKVHEKSTRFKDREMIAFEGRFVVNAILPACIGLGKAVSRGFGTII